MTNPTLLIHSIRPVLDAIIATGGTPLVVGGAVRDLVMGIEPKDIDIEVYNLMPEELVACLRAFGDVNQVGASFGVLKITFDMIDLDISIPRTEQKVGRGHKGFIPTPDPFITPPLASARRDFTMNSMSMDVDGVIHDPYNGLMDIKDKVLRNTSAAFSEDPLRILRGVQFAARFSMLFGKELTSVCTQGFKDEYKYLSIDRIWGEWKKFFLKGKAPLQGLDFLVSSGWIDHYPEIKVLLNCEQDPEWHPEGDVYKHTGYTLKAAYDIAERDGLSEDERLVLSLAALCHDFGKPITTVSEASGRIASKGHDTAGDIPTRTFLERIGCPDHIARKVRKLVAEHMAHVGIDAPSHRIVRRLADRLSPATMTDWIRLVEADQSGRPPLAKGVPEIAKEMYGMSVALSVSDNKPARILTGKLLIASGMTPSRRFSAILDAAYEAQLEGCFSDEKGAILWFLRSAEKSSSLGSLL